MIDCGTLGGGGPAGRRFCGFVFGRGQDSMALVEGFVFALRYPEGVATLLPHLGDESKIVRCIQTLAIVCP